MSQKTNIIINVLIIILIIALVTVMMSYYTGAFDVPTGNEFSSGSYEKNNSGDNSAINNDNIEKTNDDKIIVNDNPDSGENFVNDEKNINDIKNEEIESGDIENNNIEGNQQENIPTSPVIITSENDISSKEKGEILTELDKTLMELLEVVDKVQPVDETRLITDDSEVQE